MTRAEWKCYSEPKDAWDAMLSDIESARRTVDFEQYIFTDFDEGSVGRRFIDAFIRKAKEGVSVRVLLDAQGSYALMISPWANRLKEAGVYLMFHAASMRKIRRAHRSLFRDHRKLCVIDHEIAHVGGVIEQDRAREWGDLNIRFKGPVARNVAGAFNAAWRGHSELNAYLVTEPMRSDDGFEVVGSGPRPQDRHILNALIEAVRTARNEIRIASPYFDPPRELFDALAGARERGIEIELILPKDIDNVFAKYATHARYEELLGLGIKLHLFDSYIHAKAVVIDGEWATAGSANMDNLSLLHNYELNVAARDREFAESLTRCLDSQKENCVELTIGEWKERPQRGKVLEKLSGVIRPVA